MSQAHVVSSCYARECVAHSYGVDSLWCSWFWLWFRLNILNEVVFTPERPPAIVPLRVVFIR